MDSINILNLKIEKAKANFRFRRITALFRFIEFFVLLLFISRFSLQFPFSFKFSWDYFRPLLSPQFVFVIGNAIVLTLFLKSGWLCSGNRVSTDFCEQYVENSVKNHIVHEIESENRIKEENITGEGCNYGERRINRSYSENLERIGGEKEKSKRQLRRSVTEGRRKSTSAAEMSNEEFRKAVEDFIARQQRSLWEEELAATVSY
ncbi:hypothetical protein Vadar_017945 [Vaccinium darrowii]|uniref:Uncharacterized protein n=1 Tax=Vaccinium darrowii TaxID=229202 RepID=A0ACB7X1L4_9ERIC|nr:hypothetical protein Vadar_017945 [Vaccinium darrowii]